MCSSVNPVGVAAVAFYKATITQRDEQSVEEKWEAQEKDRANEG